MLYNLLYNGQWYSLIRVSFNSTFACHELHEENFLNNTLSLVMNSPLKTNSKILYEGYTK